MIRWIGFEFEVRLKDTFCFSINSNLYECSLCFAVLFYILIENLRNCLFVIRLIVIKVRMLWLCDGHKLEMEYNFFLRQSTTGKRYKKRRKFVETTFIHSFCYSKTLDRHTDRQQSVIIVQTWNRTIRNYALISLKFFHKWRKSLSNSQKF